MTYLQKKSLHIIFNGMNKITVVFSLSLSLQVSLHREFTFRNSKQRYYGIPVIASNMDTVGTFESALELAKVSVHENYYVYQLQL